MISVHRFLYTDGRVPVDDDDKLYCTFFVLDNVGVNAGMRRWRGRISTTVIYLTKMLDKYRVNNVENHLNYRYYGGILLLVELFFN